MKKKFPHIHIGMRIVKTMIAVLLSLLVYILLLFIDKWCGMDRSSWRAPSNMYTPFFASIAAVYATHKDTKSSFRQAKIRSIGSIIGGYFGMALIFISEYIFITLIHLDESNFILYKAIEFLIVSLGLIPLILITIRLKQQTATFITCLTYLSVTISIRNGGMPVFQFATNRIISTIVGVGLSILVNNLFIFRKKNKDVIFVSSLDNNFINQDDKISPYIKYKLNDLYYKDMKLSFATTRTLSSLIHIFDEVEVNYPMVIMNGSTIYDFSKQNYSDIKYLSNETRIYIDEELKKHNLQGFLYTINENVMHAYHNILINEGEIDFKNRRKEGAFYSFVRGELPADLGVSLYIVIDKEEKIKSFLNEVNSSQYKDLVDLVIYPYELEGYYYLKINSRDARKEYAIKSIMNQNSINKLVVCGSGNTDIPLMEQADLAICLSTAPDYVKKHADYIVDGGPAKVLKLFDKIYHCNNLDKFIKKLKDKSM